MMNINPHLIGDRQIHIYISKINYKLKYKNKNYEKNTKTLGTKDFLGHKRKNSNYNIMNFCKTRIFCCSKDIIKRVKRQAWSGKDFCKAYIW